MSRLPQARSASSPTQASSDGRGGSETKGTTKGPRYLYYRMYTKDGAINSNNPIYANDPFISRALTKLITPPHTALTVKGHLCSIEGFSSTTTCTLFESFYSQAALENSTRLSIRGHSGPGLSADRPVFVVVEPQEVEMRSAAKVQAGKLPDALLHEPRYLYYRIYKAMEGATASKTCFDPDDDTLGRIDILSIAPPHNVASLKYRMMKAEGTITQKTQIFKDIDGEELMNDDDQLYFLAETYPGCEEDDPIAIVCGEVNQDGRAKPQESPQERQKNDQRFSKSIKVTKWWAPDPPVWLPPLLGEVLKTDGVKTSAVHGNNSTSYDGYIAMNSVGTIGFVPAQDITFC